MNVIFFVKLNIGVYKTVKALKRERFRVKFELVILII